MGLKAFVGWCLVLAGLCLCAWSLGGWVGIGVVVGLYLTAVGTKLSQE